MTSWTLLLCEGAHDQAALKWLACICGGWKPHDGVPRLLPHDMQITYPEPTRQDSRRWGWEKVPDYLAKNGRFLVVRCCGSKQKVLGEIARDLARIGKPEAVGVVVDANGDGVENCAKAFKNSFGQVFTHAQKVQPGTVVEGSPRLGLWVAPNNKDAGSMDDSLVDVARYKKEKLIKQGERFITGIEKIELVKLGGHRSKAILGAVHQAQSPGASLASALNKGKCWFDKGAKEIAPFGELLVFIETLTGS